MIYRVIKQEDISIVFFPDFSLSLSLCVTSNMFLFVLSHC